MPPSHHHFSNIHQHSILSCHGSSIVDWLEEIPRSTSPSTTLFEAQHITSTFSGNEKALDESEEENEAEKGTMSPRDFPTHEMAMPDPDAQSLPQPASSSTCPSESENRVERLEGATPPVFYQSLDSGRVEEVSDEAWGFAMDLRRFGSNKRVIPVCFKVSQKLFQLLG